MGTELEATYKLERYLETTRIKEETLLNLDEMNAVNEKYNIEIPLPYTDEEMIRIREAVELGIINILYAPK